MPSTLGGREPLGDGGRQTCGAQMTEGESGQMAGPRKGGAWLPCATDVWAGGDRRGCQMKALGFYPRARGNH